MCRPPSETWYKVPKPITAVPAELCQMVSCTKVIWPPTENRSVISRPTPSANAMSETV